MAISKESLKDYNKSIGVTIRDVRKQEGLSLGELSNAIGISQQQVSKYERGESTMSLPMFLEISNALHVNVEDLIPNKKRKEILVLSKIKDPSVKKALRKIAVCCESALAVE
jgi:transcriptional regulator with XRE-family HTH domain